MKIIFIDESSNKVNYLEYFILTGVIVDCDVLFDFEAEIEKFKKKLTIRNLKDMRGQENTKELVSISKNYGIKSISVILGNISSKKQLREKYKEALDLIVERFFLYLKPTNHGFIFFDSTTLQNEIGKNGTTMIKERGVSMYSRPRGCFLDLGEFKELIYPSILFTDDQSSNSLQLADRLCKAINGALKDSILNVGDLKLKNKEDDLLSYGKYLNLYYDLFMNKNGKIGGYGIKFWN